MRRFVVFALAILWSATLVASESSQARFVQIQSYVMRLDKVSFTAYLDEQIKVTKSFVTVRKTRPVHKSVLDEIIARVGTLPEFSSRKIEFVTFRTKLGSSFAPAAIAVGDIIFVSEKFLDEMLDSLNGRNHIAAVVAHELGHGSRDFLINGGLENDTTLSKDEKEKLFLQVETQADMAGMDILQRAGYDPKLMVAMLGSVNLPDRRSAAETTLRNAFAAGASQQ